MRSVVLALILACAHAPIAPPLLAPQLPWRQRDQTADGFYLQPAGLADDYPEESRPVEKMRRDLAAMHAVGARHLRFGIGWDSVEAEPGKYDWALWDALFALLREAGITPLPYVCYTLRWLNPWDPKDYWRRPPSQPGRFGAFVGALAARYRGQVPSWELWNEPDNDFYWLSTAEQFAQLVEDGARAVRAADPGAKVVLGGMSKWGGPFLEEALRRFGVGRAVDVINQHRYLETWDGARAEEYPARIEAVARLVRETAPHADLWLAEFGYSNWRRTDGRPSEWSYAVHDYEHTPEFQSVALFRAHVLALASERLSLTAWYRIDDLPAGEEVIGDEANKHLGILDVHGRPKPAFHALRLYEKLLAAPVRLADARVEVRGGTGAVAHVFEKRSGELIVTAWLPSAAASADPGGRGPDTREVTVGLRLPIRPRAALEVFDVTTGERVPSDAALDGPLLAPVRLRGGGIFVARVSPPR